MYDKSKIISLGFAIIYTCPYACCIHGHTCVAIIVGLLNRCTINKKIALHWF